MKDRQLRPLAYRALVVAALSSLFMFLTGWHATVRSPVHSATAVSVSGIHYGVKITLRVPRLTYSRDALIDAVVRVRNVSSHMITAPGVSCTQQDPWVESLAPDGAVLYPAGIRWLDLIPPCGATTEDTFMGPGYVSRPEHVYVIARSPIIRAVLAVRDAHNNLVHAVTPSLVLKLGLAKPPKVVIRTTPVVSASIRSPALNHGTWLYLSLDHCMKGNAPYDYYGVYWSPVIGRKIEPECDHPISWRAIVGRLGDSVAFIHYRQSH